MKIQAVEIRFYRKILGYLIQGPRYQRGSSCQDPAGNGTTRRPSDNRKETQTEVVWTCLPLIRSGQNHLARHNKKGKKTRQTEEEVGRPDQGIGRHAVRLVLESSGEQRKVEETGCEVIIMWCPNDPHGYGIGESENELSAH